MFSLLYEMVSKVGAINRIVVVVVVAAAVVADADADADAVAAAGVVAGGAGVVAGGAGVVAGAGCCGFIVNTINTTCTFCYWQLRWCETTLKAFRLRGFEKGLPKH